MALIDAKFPTSKSNFLRPFGFPKSSKVSISVAFWLCKALWILYISPDARPTSEIMHKQIWKIAVVLVVIFIVNVESIFHKLEFFVERDARSKEVWEEPPLVLWSCVQSCWLGVGHRSCCWVISYIWSGLSNNPLTKYLKGSSRFLRSTLVFSSSMRMCESRCSFLERFSS